MARIIWEDQTPFLPKVQIKGKGRQIGKLKLKETVIQYYKRKKALKKEKVAIVNCEKQ